MLAHTQQAQQAQRAADFIYSSNNNLNWELWRMMIKILKAHSTQWFKKRASGELFVQKALYAGFTMEGTRKQQHASERLTFSEIIIYFRSVHGDKVESEEEYNERRKKCQVTSPNNVSAREAERARARKKVRIGVILRMRKWIYATCKTND
jgi:hypothetical protein